MKMFVFLADATPINADDRVTEFVDQLYTVIEGVACTNCCTNSAFAVFCSIAVVEECKQSFCGNDNKCYTRPINQNGACTYEANDIDDITRTLPGTCIGIFKIDHRALDIH